MIEALQSAEVSARGTTRSRPVATIEGAFSLSPLGRHLSALEGFASTENLERRLS